MSQSWLGQFVQGSDSVCLVIEVGDRLRLVSLDLHGKIQVRVFKPDVVSGFVPAQLGGLTEVLRLQTAVLTANDKKLGRAVKDQSLSDLERLLRLCGQGCIQRALLYELHPIVIGTIVRVGLHLCEDQSFAALLYLGSGECPKEDVASCFEKVAQNPPLELPVVIFSEGAVSRPQIKRALSIYRDRYPYDPGHAEVATADGASFVFPLIAYCLNDKSESMVSSALRARRVAVREYSTQMMLVRERSSNPATDLIATVTQWLSGAPHEGGAVGTGKLLLTPLAKSLLRKAVDDSERVNVIRCASITLSAARGGPSFTNKQLIRAVSELGGLVSLIPVAPDADSLRAISMLIQIPGTTWVKLACKLVEWDSSLWGCVGGRIGEKLDRKQSLELKRLAGLLNPEATGTLISAPDQSSAQMSAISMWIVHSVGPELLNKWLLAEMSRESVRDFCGVVTVMGLGGCPLLPATAIQVGTELINRLAILVETLPNSTVHAGVEALLRNGLDILSKAVSAADLSGVIVRLAVRSSQSNIWSELLIRKFRDSQDLAGLATCLVMRVTPYVDELEGAQASPLAMAIEISRSRLSPQLERMSAEMSERANSIDGEGRVRFLEVQGKLLAAVRKPGMSSVASNRKFEHLEQALEKMKYETFSLGGGFDTAKSGLEFGSFVRGCKSLRHNTERLEAASGGFGVYGLELVAAALCSELEILEREMCSAEGGASWGALLREYRATMKSLGLLPINENLGAVMDREHLVDSAYEAPAVPCTQWRVATMGLMSASGRVFRKAMLVPAR